MNEIVAAIVGGVVIGLSASLLLLFKGRVFGISGILGGIIKPKEGDTTWRLMILLGLFAGGAVTGLFLPNAFPENDFPIIRMVIAGLLVGFGTQLGGGCTSGHGVCGISRLSPRSIIATVTFIGFGVLTVFILSMFGGV